LILMDVVDEKLPLFVMHLEDSLSAPMSVH